MSDQSVGGFGRSAHPRPVRVEPPVVWAIAAAAVVAFMVYAARREGGWGNMGLALGATLSIASVLVLLTRRLLFATVATSALVIVLITVSAAKQRLMNSVAHAYDLVFYLSSWSTVSYLWSDHFRYLIGFLLAVLATGVATWAAYRFDGTRIHRRHAAIVLGGCMALVGCAAVGKGERRHTQFEYEGLYLSSFFSSWSETVETLLRGQLVEAAASPAGPSFVIPATCHTATRPPHIILVHQESVVQPSLFPTLSYDKALDPFFRSFDGKLHRMRVETYGGASWLTEFSLLAGVSSYSFGGMRQFVQTLMQDKLRETLPQTLERCGYRNVLFYPMLRNFVSNGRFFQSVGLREIFDLKDQGARTVNERDRFYYANALAEMERHVARTDQPLFTYIQTMAAHWPYDQAYMPEVDVPGGGPGTHPEISEYLRRLAMGRLDMDYLRSELKRRFPAERFLIVHYGDHHPMATRVLLGFNEETEAEDVAIDRESIGFITYYAVEGINYQPPPLPDVETLDVPYLGTVMLEAAGLPLSDAYRERKRLLALCGGRYYGCSDRQAILSFHRRLIDSGLMQAR
jgi:hypothetical protein